VLDDEKYLDDYEYHRRQMQGLSLEDVIVSAAPYIARSLLKRHQSLILIIGLADVVLEVHRQYKSKRPMGELILLHGDYH
jgi:hypothetical protein